MRGLGLLACLIACGATPLAAQRGAWSGAFAAGYGTGAGDAFSGKGAVWATAAGFRELSPSVRAGIELGYHRFKAIESRIPDAYGPASLISEDFRRSFWQASATVRFRASQGAWRPYFGSGLGAYLVHVHDHFRTQDPTGALIPGLQFDQTTAEVKPGAHLVAGIERAAALGGAGLGVQARWDGVLAGGLANVLSVGVVLTLE
jgi:hypothetical protein